MEIFEKRRIVFHCVFIYLCFVNYLIFVMINYLFLINFYPQQLEKIHKFDSQSLNDFNLQLHYLYFNLLFYVSFGFNFISYSLGSCIILYIFISFSYSYFLQIINLIFIRFFFFGLLDLHFDSLILALLTIIYQSISIISLFTKKNCLHFCYCYFSFFTIFFAS